MNVDHHPHRERGRNFTLVARALPAGSPAFVPIARELAILRSVREHDDRGHDTARSLLRLATHFARLPNPQAVTALLCTARSMSVRAFTAEAYLDLRRIAGPRFDRLFVEAGVALRDRGERHRAIDVLGAVAATGNPLGSVALAESLATFGDPRGAMGELARALERLEELPFAGHEQTWRRMLALATELEPQDEESHRRLARLDLDAGDSAAAMKRITVLLALRPSDPTYLELMAESLARSRRIPAALASLRAVAQLHVDAGRPRWAHQLLRRARAWNPGDVAYAAALQSLAEAFAPTTPSPHHAASARAA